MLNETLRVFTYKNLQYSMFINTVDCSNSALTPGYSYFIPNPATLGATMKVQCSTGYHWGTSLINLQFTATCTNVNGVGQWTIDNGDSCMGIALFYIQYSINLNFLIKILNFSFDLSAVC